MERKRFESLRERLGEQLRADVELTVEEAHRESGMRLEVQGKGRAGSKYRRIAKVADDTAEPDADDASQQRISDRQAGRK